jgi:hypothetical protein
MRYDRFWTRRYRATLYFHERLRLVDFVDFLLILIAGSISAFGKAWPVYILLGIYLVIVVCKLAYTIRTRDTTSHLKAAVITGLLNFTNKELFRDSNSTRYTIFRVAPFRPDYIIPWIRFKRSGRGGLKEAFSSRARFRRGEGITGQVWEKPPGQLAIQLIPAIPGQARNLLRVLYENKYGVKADTFDAISDHMGSVRCIISYVCLDEHAQFLNLLSLDIAAPVETVPIESEPGSVYLELQDNGQRVQIDTQSLWRLVSMIGTVLLQFQHEQYKKKEG